MSRTSPRFTRVLLPVLALAAAAPLAAQDAERVPGNKYLVVNGTDAPLACRYRVNSVAAGGAGAGWQTADAIAAGGAFSHTARAPGESVTLDCSADAKATPITVRPGARYQATRGADGQLVIAPNRA